MESEKRDPRRVGLSGPDDHAGAAADATEVDATLRRLLEPNPLAVERLVRTALSEGEKSSAARQVRWWPRLAAAATAFVLLMVFLVPRSSVHSPPPDGDADSVASSEPARISISNDDGFVTISSTAGSKWILYSGDDS